MRLSVIEQRIADLQDSLARSRDRRAVSRKVHAHVRVHPIEYVRGAWRLACDDGEQPDAIVGYTRGEGWWWWTRSGSGSAASYDAAIARAERELKKGDGNGFDSLDR